MATAGPRSMRAGRDRLDERGERTAAEWYGTLAGLALLSAGVFGFIADASFDTGAVGDADTTGNADGALQGDGFLGFEVNGWHNPVHLASGLCSLPRIRACMRPHILQRLARRTWLP